MSDYASELNELKRRIPNAGGRELVEIETRIAQISAEFDRRQGTNPSYKSAAILRGVDGGAPATWGDNYNGPEFLAALKSARRGDPESNAYLKGVLGTSDATGQSIVPNAFVAGLSDIARAKNIFRSLMQVNTGIRAAAIDIPYELTGVTKALLQGAYGSNKDIRDYSFGQATATLYTIAQIADIGNQLLRQSGGVAEAQAKRRLGDSIGLAESDFIVNGTGTSQPLGILTALLQAGDIAANKYTLSSESRVSALANGMGKLDARGVRPTGIVMHPTDYWEMATETLGTSGSGGWALDPASGAAGSAPTASVFGVPVFRCADLTVGTAIAADWTAFDIYLGQDFRIDVSTEGGNRFDQNVTGYRAEEDFGFNAEPPVRTGKVVKILGL